MKTGVAFDSIFLRHNQPGHPENAKRLESIMSSLESKNLLEKMIDIKSRKAEIDEIAECHTQSYIDYVKEFCEKGGGYFDPDTYSNSYSFNAAQVAIGTSIDLTKAVVTGELKNGFALLRPPGHHALASRSMGFCLFGNISIAAKLSLNQSGIEKVAIVDFDVHHGNGTQALVGDDPKILFISSHQYPFYPGTGSINEIGTGKAENTILNIPLEVGVGDAGFKIIYEEIIIPSLIRFQPDLILVSAGYDAHKDDPLANLNLSLTGFNWISRELIKVADEICAGKIIFFLEGGYNLEVLGNGVSNSVRGLLGIQEFDDPLGNSIIREPDLTDLVRALKRIHSL